MMRGRTRLDRFFLLILTALLLLAALTGCGGELAGGETVSSEPPDPQAGQRLYENFCLSCHGPRGKGDGPAAASLHPRPADLTALLPTCDDDTLAARIAEGKDGTAMAAWKNVLNETQIRQIVAYLRTQK